MSENQATENVTDDFDAFNEDAQRDSIPAQADSDDAFGGDLDFDQLGEEDDLFAGADLDFEEEDSGESIQYRDAGDVYDNPLERGIKDKMWVAIRLSDVTFKEKHTPRLSSEVCLAVTKNPETGKPVIKVTFDDVEKAIANGATEIIRKQELPYFIASANHVAPEFGQRRYPYEIEVPALTIKTKNFREQRSKKTGYKNESGYSLRKATNATQEGDKVNLQTMPGIAERMDDEIVMARIKISTTKKAQPRLDPVTKKPISVLVDLENAKPITVVAIERQKNEDGTLGEQEYMYDNDSGTLYEGSPKLLIPLGDKVFAILDSGESSANLMEETVKVTDYLDRYAPFLPVPDRDVSVEMIAKGKNGETVSIDGQITYATVGAIVNGTTPGTPVDVLLKTGKTITAVWVGTHWIEFSPEGDADNESDGEFAGAKNL